MRRSHPPDVTLKHAPVPLDGNQSGRRDDAPFADGPEWWPACIKARLGCELPLPDDATERARNLERAANELFGSAPTADEREAFAKVADENSLSVFIAQLVKRPGLVSFFGRSKDRFDRAITVPTARVASGRVRSSTRYRH